MYKLCALTARLPYVRRYMIAGKACVGLARTVHIRTPYMTLNLIKKVLPRITVYIPFIYMALAIPKHV
jgi:hypothetical protein